MQVCHVAAQYGQTKFLYHVTLHWQADFEKTDKDGRTSLHWAAYKNVSLRTKGFGDIIRLLIFMDAHVDLVDKEGDHSTDATKAYTYLARFRLPAAVEDRVFLN
eukprot:scaffold68895_cov35-Prasinocladus_malaysianus.AAC.4